ncbi:RDD family protein [Nocardioides sp.]|uniref:RDD family protein n=1 Tax=Nocardioides sp. TaxID=35761 RepID=UPI003517BB40
MSDYASLTEDDLVTGEAVALDLPAAGVAVRMAAGLLDLLVTVLVLVLAFLVAGIATIRADDALVQTAVVLATVLVFVVVPATVETLTGGRSVGKLALGLRVVRDDAGPITAQHAGMRHLVGFVEIYLSLGAVAFFSMLLSARGKRVGDYAAGTYVVRARVPLRLAPPAVMPPHLASWAAGADVARLPVPLALAVRQFLGRAPELMPGARWEVAVRLAERVAPFVAPAPPAGTHPEDLLRAVIATRRDRDAARLAREDAVRRRLLS